MVEQISLEEFGVMKEQVNSIYKAVMGNGQPGIIQNLDKACSRLDKTEGAIGAIKWMIGVFGVSSIVALFAVIRLYI